MRRRTGRVVGLVPCGTCLECCGIEFAVGWVGSMGGILQTLELLAKVATI